MSDLPQSRSVAGKSWQLLSHNTKHSFALAVNILNDFIKLNSDFPYESPAIMDADIILTDSNGRVLEAKKTQRGLYLWKKLSSGIYHLNIKCNNFQEEIRTINISENISTKQNILLKPGYDFPYPEKSVWLRSTVIDSQSMPDNPIPVAGIPVQLTFKNDIPAGRSQSTITDSLGRFIFYFKNLKQDFIANDISDQSVKMTIDIDGYYKYTRDNKLEITDQQTLSYFKLEKSTN